MNMFNPQIVASGTGTRTINNTLAINGNFSVLPGNDLVMGFSTTVTPGRMCTEAATTVTVTVATTFVAATRS